MMEAILAFLLSLQWRHWRDDIDLIITNRDVSMHSNSINDEGDISKVVRLTHWLSYDSSKRRNEIEWEAKLRQMEW